MDIDKETLFKFVSETIKLVTEQQIAEEVAIQLQEFKKELYTDFPLIGSKNEDTNSM